MTTAEHPRKSKADAVQAKPGDPPAQTAAPADPAPEADRFAHVRPGLVGIFSIAGGVQLVLRRDGDTAHLVGNAGYVTCDVTELVERDSPRPGDALELLADHIAAGFSLAPDTAPFAAPSPDYLPILTSPAGMAFRRDLLKAVCLEQDSDWEPKDVIEEAAGHVRNFEENAREAEKFRSDILDALGTPHIARFPTSQHDAAIFNRIAELRKAAGPDRATILRAGIIDGIGDTDEEESDFSLIARLKGHIDNETEADKIIMRWDRFRFGAAKFINGGNPEEMLAGLEALHAAASKAGLPAKGGEA